MLGKAGNVGKVHKHSSDSYEWELFCYRLTIGQRLTRSDACHQGQNENDRCLVSEHS